MAATAAAGAASADVLAASRDKRKRYDRQLRLWGEHGQEALENARICVLYATATGTETAKNLVLPGVGEITLVDPQVVTKADLGKNFFVDGDSVGKQRAEVCATLLRELNELIQVRARVGDPVAMVDSEPEFFKQFTIIILADNFPLSSVLKLDALCNENRIALFYVRSNGFMGSLRISTQEHRIYESKPDNFKPDLRVMNPWPELQQFAMEFPITADMDQGQYKHVPWLVLMLRLLNDWRASHGGKEPQNKAEQTDFRRQIDAMRRRGDEENVDELAANAHFAWVPMNIPAEMKRILSDPKTEVSAGSRPFWVMAAAVKAFVAGEGQGQLPLPGTLPDMVADTRSFIDLQRLFKDKAERDYQAVRAHVRRLLRGIGRPEDSIRDEYIRLACKNTWFWTLIRYRTINQEWTSPSTGGLAMALQFTKQMDGGCASLYLAQRAADRFRDRAGRLPGAVRDAATMAGDADTLRGLMTECATEFGVSAEEAEVDTYAREFTRWGGAELHNTAAFMGGVAAQEVIKVITEQLVPVNNTFVYNAGPSFTATYEL